MKRANNKPRDGKTANGAPKQHREKASGEQKSFKRGAANNNTGRPTLGKKYTPRPKTDKNSDSPFNRNEGDTTENVRGGKYKTTGSDTKRPHKKFNAPTDEEGTKRPKFKASNTGADTDRTRKKYDGSANAGDKKYDTNRKFKPRAEGENEGPRKTFDKTSNGEPRKPRPDKKFTPRTNEVSNGRPRKTIDEYTIGGERRFDPNRTFIPRKAADGDNPTKKYGSGKPSGEKKYTPKRKFTARKAEETIEDDDDLFNNLDDEEENEEETPIVTLLRAADKKTPDTAATASNEDDVAETEPKKKRRKLSWKQMDEMEEEEEAPKAEEKMPLNKYLAHSGLCSRRDAAIIVKEGKVRVNDELILDPGFKINPDDVVTVNDKKMALQKGLVYILLNKPKDYITTNEDPQDRKKVMDLVAGADAERLFPVGRLDRKTSGLLLITNDGDLTQKLSHPSFKVKKVYQVTLDKPVTKADFDKIIAGVTLDDGLAEVDAMAYLDTKNEIGLEIHSGRNRIVRRIFEHLGYVVEKLDRVMYAGLTKKNLPRGKWRYLNEREIVLLKHFKG